MLLHEAQHCARLLLHCAAQCSPTQHCARQWHYARMLSSVLSLLIPKCFFFSENNFDYMYIKNINIYNIKLVSLNRYLNLIFNKFI